MHDWMVKVFLPLIPDEFIGPRAKILYAAVKKYNVSGEEYLFLRHCSIYMASNILATGVVTLYNCTLEEATLILDAVNF